MTSLTVRRKSCILAATSRAREQARKLNIKKREISWRKVENSQVTIPSPGPCLQPKSCKCLCSAVSLNTADGLDFTNFVFYPLNRLQVVPCKILCFNIWETMVIYSIRTFQWSLIFSYHLFSRTHWILSWIKRSPEKHWLCLSWSLHCCHYHPCLAGVQLLSCKTLYTAR